MIVRHMAQAAKFETEVAQKVFEGANTPVSLSCFILMKYGELDQLLKKDVNPLDYSCPSAFADDYLVTSLLSKSKVLDVGVDKAAAARDDFYKAEELCKLTNQRLLSIWYESSDNEAMTTLLRVRERIMEILGTDLTHYDLQRAEREFGFGPGSTYDIRRVVTSGRKYGSHKVTTTPSLASYVFALPRLWRDTVTTIDVVNGNRWMSVPKNWKKDRGICAEPTMNIYVQKGFGSVLKSKLRSSGVDLTTQEWNQWLAREGSRDNTLATIDLSMASDTISWMTVRCLMPDRWFDLLNSIRSPMTQMPNGEWVVLEKFSSMGNGFTFELETLIFTGVVRSVIPPSEWCRTAIYGDDMIVPACYYDEVVRTLNLLGFKVNAEKSFGEGPFRESCGGDYFLGIDVRPFFLRTEHEDPVETAYITANLISKYAEKRMNGLGRDGRFLPAYLRVLRRISKEDRLDVPPGMEANGLVGNNKDARNVPTQYRYRKRTVRKKTISPYGVYLSNLSGTRTDFSYGEESLRGRFGKVVYKRGHALAWPLYQEWYA